MKGLVRSHHRGDPQVSPIRNISFLVSKTISVTDGAPGYGTVVIGDFPEGNVLLLGAVSYMQFLTADADVTATYEGDYSVGTAPTADGTLSGSEVDIIPSTAIAAATAKLSPVTRGATTHALGGTILDNTDGALELNLNLLIDDASISGNADFTVTGQFHVSYIMLGDD